jgi:hypothetical protein
MIYNIKIKVKNSNELINNKLYFHMLAMTASTWAGLNQ